MCHCQFEHTANLLMIWYADSDICDFCDTSATRRVERHEVDTTTLGGKTRASLGTGSLIEPASIPYLTPLPALPMHPYKDSDISE